ncbi:hypothetical protein AHF37_06033 [Paragonimus kellicotti]|nr:hypothetical protein AHF37_06033 [Paragonimus kellicotti]
MKIGFFFQKTEGGYCLYSANIPGRDDHEREVSSFLHACEEATASSKEFPITLMSVSDFELAVFDNGITNNPQQASRLAQGAFTDVMTGKSNLHEDFCEDGELNLQVHRGNLTLNTSKP